MMNIVQKTGPDSPAHQNPQNEICRPHQFKVFQSNELINLTF